MGPLKEQGVYLPPEWCAHCVTVSGDKRETLLTSLRMKIKKHVESKAHEIGEIISSTKNENIIKTAIAKVATASDAATEAYFAPHITSENQIDRTVITAMYLNCTNLTVSMSV